MDNKKVGYLLLVHDDVNHFRRLCERLSTYDDYIFVHVDKKANLELFIDEVAHIGNIFFVDKQFDVSWAGISMIYALNELVASALTSFEEFTHFVFLTGSCYPVKDLYEFKTFLNENKSTQFIKYINMLESPDHYVKQIKFKWFLEPLFYKGTNVLFKKIDRLCRKLLRVLRIKNEWDSSLVPYYGSTWCALTPDCCQYLLDYQAKNPHYLLMNTNTFAVDEHFYHTIIGNSAYSASSTGLQKFEGRGLWRLANFHVIDPSLSKWYTLKDLDDISFKEKFFIRKVRTVDGEELVNMLDSKL